jgi:hypothetical protein
MSVNDESRIRRRAMRHGFQVMRTRERERERRPHQVCLAVATLDDIDDFLKSCVTTRRHLH